MVRLTRIRWFGSVDEAFDRSLRSSRSRYTFVRLLRLILLILLLWLLRLLRIRRFCRILRHREPAPAWWRRALCRFLGRWIRRRLENREVLGGPCEERFRIEGDGRRHFGVLVLLPSYPPDARRNAFRHSECYGLLRVYVPYSCKISQWPDLQLKR